MCILGQSTLFDPLQDPAKLAVEHGVDLTALRARRKLDPLDPLDQRPQRIGGFLALFRLR
ncbi:hypothetical protein [Sphingobium sp. Ant17]|uniref:hypothetical protein n=1 Tax=Sphingobium sp. Ant17 TaxID=1461752 RepID=UPI00044BDF8C|nr:hypothetical protein [Sphingobium sp. Ant17]EXS69953.1 hypothetical protein BF95_07840 [Sphingobium sp. Ant17]